MQDDFLSAEELAQFQATVQAAVQASRRPELPILEFKVAAWTATPWDDGSSIQVHHNAASKRNQGVHVDNNGNSKRLATVLTYLSDVANGAPAHRCCQRPVGGPVGW